MWHLSEKPHQEEEIARELDSAATETVSEVGTELNMKRIQLVGRRMINIQHVTQNNRTLLGPKLAKSKNVHDLIDCNMLCLQEGMCQLLYLIYLIRQGRYIHIHCIPHNLKPKVKVLHLYTALSTLASKAVYNSLTPSRQLNQPWCGSSP